MVQKIELAINNIEQLIKEQLPASHYQFELYDLISDTRHFRGHDELIHWGSVYKLFVVAEIIKMADEGILQLNSEVDLDKNLYRHGNGIVKHLTHLDKLSYLDACKMTIAVSDNLCSDTLLNIVGFDRLNNLFRQAECYSSQLYLNLNDLVIRLFQNIPQNTSVNFFQSEEYFMYFDTQLNTLLELNHTNARDINTCFHYIFSHHLSVIGIQKFKECLLLPIQHSRLSYYTFFSKLLLKGKTGMLGLGIVNNETVAIFNNSDHEIYGYFTLATQGNRKRYFQSNDTFGLVGIEIIKLYEQLIMGDV